MPRVSSTIMLMDASYYGVGPDTSSTAAGGTGGINGYSGVVNPANWNGNEWAYSTATNGFYGYYWMNQGGGLGAGVGWSVDADGSDGVGTPTEFAQATSASGIQSRHNGHLNVQWVDGHTKNLVWTQTVGNICYWTTDADGAHAGCG